jgi:hypothetical protein
MTDSSVATLHCMATVHDTTFAAAAAAAAITSEFY